MGYLRRGKEAGSQDVQYNSHTCCFISYNHTNNYKDIRYFYIMGLKRQLFNEKPQNLTTVSYVPSKPHKSNSMPSCDACSSSCVEVSVSLLHYVHQLVAIFVCLLLGAGRVVCSGFIRASSLKAPGASRHLFDLI